MSRVVGVSGVVAPHGYPQPVITAAFEDVVSREPRHHAAVRRVHAATGVEHRYLALPLERYAGLSGFGEANDAFISVGLDLAEQAITEALRSAGLTAPDVDLLVSTSVTGVAVPSLDARLVGRLGLREDVKRLPLFGLGCVAGAAGVARVHDYLEGHPDELAVLVSVELCSLTVQRDDTSMANVVASGLFGDGGAAVVMAGERRAAGRSGPQVVASRSRLYPDSERTMGWDVDGGGFRIVLSASVPDMVTEHVGHDVRSFLGEHGLSTDDVSAWVCHPGGPKVLEALEAALDLHDGQLDATWRSLAAVGNLSSSSVLHVLRDTVEAESGGPPRGSYGVLLAMGPGFCSEIVLVRW